MATSDWASKTGLQVAVRGVALGPVPGIILGPSVATSNLRRPGVALAVRSPWSDEWTPLVASPRQILMPWDRWCALRRAALAEHPWPTEAVRRLVEMVPEGTRRLRVGTGGRDYRAFAVDPSPSQRLIANALLSTPGFRVETYATPTEALQRSMPDPPDLMVMVVRGTASDALALMRASHEVHGHRTPPVIWCATAMPTVEDANEGARLGLRAVMMTPWRLLAFVALAVRVCRDGERERRLVARGVPADQIASRILDRVGTWLWAQVEAEVSADSPGPLTLVHVGGDTPEVMAAVRPVIRSSDMIGRGVDGSFIILLPDVDEAGALSVAARVTGAVSAMRPRPRVAYVTRRAEEDAVDLLARLLAERHQREAQVH